MIGSRHGQHLESAVYELDRQSADIALKLKELFLGPVFPCRNDSNNNRSQLDEPILDSSSFSRSLRRGRHDRSSIQILRSPCRKSELKGRGLEVEYAYNPSLKNWSRHHAQAHPRSRRVHRKIRRVCPADSGEDSQALS